MKRATLAAVALAALVAGCVTDRSAAAWCGTLAEERDERAERDAERDAFTAWCRAEAGNCDAGGVIALRVLPRYDDACGYLPPVYGDDC